MDDSVASRGDVAGLRKRIAEVREQLEELESRLPAHSTPASMMMAKEALEEELSQLSRKLKEGEAT